MKIDETNKAIIKQLLDGRKPYSAIADELSITENTVRSRVNKLIEEGVLQITGLVDPETIPGLQVCVMGIKLKTMDLGGKAREISRLKGVISAAVVTGRYDLLVNVLLNEDEEYSLIDFFTKELVKVAEIQNVETFVVYESHNLQVPYIL
ncbi:MAG: Lrp/AsnC family transcriptional regulator [Spirochaetia bacterium]|nr:Lrp/AsnC family transcriptional regulator [Spirochaetia bacterium]MCF7946769.1 Lrp/AsnC family transcriptional regulator [Spirochaetia bacterium]MCF7953359.1 Lrp/AsnC family transcriptional regulator [Spirochaetales bacterium]